jgi:ABC-2 type transport system permease protein
MQKNYNTFLPFFTFYLSENKRFLKVWGQTILGPLINTGLFLIVFLNAVGSNYQGATSYGLFLVPGLLMMTIINNAFANTSGSVFMAKLQGYIIDTLMAPIGAFLIILAYVLSTATRSFILLVVLTIYSSLFIDLQVHNIWAILYFFLMASLIMGTLGIVVGIACSSFDQMANFTNILVVPFVFLSGTFYPIAKMPIVVQAIAQYNPIFFMIDGFRYGFTGQTEGHLVAHAITLAGLALFLFALCVYLWHKGYKLKS